MRPYGEETRRGPSWGTRVKRALVRNWNGLWRARESILSYRNFRRSIKKRARRDEEQEIAEQLDGDSRKRLTTDE